MTMQEVYFKLVDPVCALEEVCATTETPAMINVICMALRSILNEVDSEVHTEGGN